MEDTPSGFVGFAAKADGLYRKLPGGSEKRLLVDGDVTGGGGSIEIPKLQLESGRIFFSEVGEYAITDTLRCFWQGNNREFLNHNPEIWLFRYKRNSRKTITADQYFIKKSKKWAHPPHLNGLKYGSSNFFTGPIRHKVASIASYGYHTEFAMTNLNALSKMVIPVNEFEFVYGTDNNNIAYLLNASSFFDWDKSRIRFVTKPQQTHSNLSLAFRFAIVIDNPNDENCPKLIGELSDPVYLILDTKMVSGPIKKNLLSWSKTQRSYGSY